MLPHELQAELDRYEIGTHALYLRKLQGLPRDRVADLLSLSPNAIQQRENAGLGLQKITDIHNHFEALGYHTRLLIIRKDPTNALVPVPHTDRRDGTPGPRTLSRLHRPS